MIKLPKNDGLNIVPFIDVMLVLLAIVLTTSTFIAQGEIQIALPRSQSAQPPEESAKIKITIDAQNVFYLDGEAVSFEGLAARFEGVEPTTLVELRSDKSAHFESFVQVLDLLKAKRHQKFQIITERAN